MVAISSEIMMLLQRNGLKPIHKLEVAEFVESVSPINPPCLRCNNLNFYIMDVPTNHDLFGKSLPCDCNKVDRSSQYLIYSGLTDEESSYSINYEKTAKRFPKAVKAAQDTVNTRKGMLLLFGPYGTGKSGLLMAMVAMACRNGIQARYTTATKMMDDIKSTFDKRNTTTTTEQRKQYYINLPILVVDEIEKASMTGYTLETYNLIFDERYRNRQNRATCIATNLIPKKVEGKFRFLGDINPTLCHLDDRLQDARRISMIGETLRGKKR